MPNATRNQNQGPRTSNPATHPAHPRRRPTASRSPTASTTQKANGERKANGEHHPPQRAAGGSGGRPPGRALRAIGEGPEKPRDSATPGGYGGKPPGVAFIGVPTGARNA